jgi:hypothetical protein
MTDSPAASRALGVAPVLVRARAVEAVADRPLKVAVAVVVDWTPENTTPSSVPVILERCAAESIWAQKQSPHL